MATSTVPHVTRRTTLTKEDATEGPAQLHELLTIDAVYTKFDLTDIPEEYDQLVMNVIVFAIRTAQGLAGVPDDWDDVIHDLIAE